MFKVKKASLSAALGAVKDVVNRKTTLPILSNVLFEIDGGQLRATAGNGDMEISAVFEAVTGEGFEPFTCPAHMLADIVRNAAADDIAIEAVRNPVGHLDFITVKSGRSRLKLPVLPASDFPKLDAGTLPHELTLGAAKFAAALKAVAYAAETNLTRYYICGVYIRGSENGLDVVATDGHRMERRLIPATEFDQDDISAMPGIIIGSDAVKRIEVVIDGAEDVAVSYSDRRIKVSAGTLTLTSKLVEGTYPDWTRLVPNDLPNTVKTAAAILSGAISRVMTVTPEDSKAVTFTFDDGRIALATQHSATGEGEDEVEAETDDRLVIKFNGRYVAASLDRAGADQVEILLGANSGSPAIVRAAGQTENFCVLMPTR